MEPAQPACRTTATVMLRKGRGLEPAATTPTAPVVAAVVGPCSGRSGRAALGRRGSSPMPAGRAAKADQARVQLLLSLRDRQ